MDPEVADVKTSTERTAANYLQTTSVQVLTVLLIIAVWEAIGRTGV